VPIPVARGLRRGSAAVRLLSSKPAGGMDVCPFCVLSGRGLCVGLITRPEESSECGVSECDRAAWILRRP
jgi:hypothetical protein